MVVGYGRVRLHSCLVQYFSTLVAKAAPRSDIYYRQKKTIRRMAASTSVMLVHGASRLEHIEITGGCDAI